MSHKQLQFVQMNPAASSQEIKLQIKFSTKEYKATYTGKSKATGTCAGMDSELTPVTK